MPERHSNNPRKQRKIILCFEEFHLLLRVLPDIKNIPLELSNKNVTTYSKLKLRSKNNRI